MIRTAIPLVALLLGFLLAQTQTQPPAQQPASRPTAAPPAEFDKYHFVVLVRPDNPPQLPAAEAQRIQGEHLGHLGAMRDAGHLLVAGPFGERFDEKWRGLCIYDGALSREKVRELAEGDPAVKAGLMSVAIMDWYTSKGALTFPMSARGH